MDVMCTYFRLVSKKEVKKVGKFEKTCIQYFGQFVCEIIHICIFKRMQPLLIF